jgi:tetratricopeptide (TPR) repeat protein
MATGSGGRAQVTADSDFGNEFFKQTSSCLFGEALGSKLGLVSLFGMILAGGGYALNYFVLRSGIWDDYALVLMLVAGAGMVIAMLRGGTPARPKARVVKIPTTKVERVEQAAAEPAFRTASDPSPRELREAPSAYNRQQNRAAAAIPEHDLEGYQNALLHYRKAGDMHGQAEILRRLGHLAKSRGHLKEAREFYVNSRRCFNQIGDNYAEAAVLLDLGQVLESLGEQDAAGAAYREANRALLDVAMDHGGGQDMAYDHAAD